MEKKEGEKGEVGGSVKTTVQCTGCEQELKQFHRIKLYFNIK